MSDDSDNDDDEIAGMSEKELENQSYRWKKAKINKACLFGDLATVERLVAAKADVNSDSDTPLYLAIQNDHLPIVQYLLQHGGKTDKSEDGHLKTAVEHRAPGIVQALIDSEVKLTDGVVKMNEQQINDIIGGKADDDHKRIAETYKVHEILTRKTTKVLLEKMEHDKTEIEKKDESEYNNEDITKQELLLRYNDAIKYYKDEMQYQIAGVTLTKTEQKQLSDIFAAGTEKDYFVRINFVGFTGAGKTSIMLQMFLQKFEPSEITSTDGIDICLGYCIIDLATGKWKKCDKKDNDELLERINAITMDRENQIPRNEKLEQQSILQGPSLSNPKQKEIEKCDATRETTKQHIETKVDMEQKPTSQSLLPGTKQSNIKQESIKKSGATGKNFVQQHTETKVAKNRPGDLAGVETVFDNTANKQTELHQDLVDPHLNVRLQQATKTSVRNKETAFVNGFDYAGQATYYSLHQLFFSKRGINLIVLDASRNFDEPINDEDARHIGGHLTGNSKDFFRYWSKLLRYFLPKANKTNIVTVFTHKDLVEDQDELQNKKFDIQDIIEEMGMEDRFYKDIFCVNANDPEDTDLPELRNVILELSREADDWGQLMSSRWLLLEDKLMTKKSEGIRVMELTEVEELNERSSLKLNALEEIFLFLKVHHDIGTLIHFADEGLQKIVILDAQWLVDSFKTIISAKQFKDHIHRKEWNRLHKHGIVDRKFIEKVWKDNKNERFFEFKDELISFMNTMDLISSPRKYNNEGQHVPTPYYVVPCMLQKAPEDFLIKYQTAANHSNNALSFKFEYSFLPTATVYRLLATCIMEYGDKEKSKTTVYCNAAVFKVYEHHFLTLKITSSSIIANILVIGKRCADVGVSQGIKEFLDDTLKYIIDAQKTTTKYEISVSCGNSGDDGAFWLKWKDLMETPSSVCDNHKNDPPHPVYSDEIIKQWLVMENVRTKPLTRGQTTHNKSNFDKRPSHIQLGRISRCIPRRDVHLLFNALGLREVPIGRLNQQRTHMLLLLFEWLEKPNATLQALTSALEEHQGYKLDVEDLEDISDYWREDFHIDKLDKKLSDAPDIDIDTVCLMTGSKYLQLGLELGFLKEQVDTFEKDYKYCHKITRQIIKSWIDKKKDLATWKVLGDALSEIRANPEFIKEITTRVSKKWCVIA